MNETKEAEDDDSMHIKSLNYYISSLCDKVQELERLRKLNAELKMRLQPLITQHHQLATKRMECLMIRSQLSILKEFYQKQKASHHKEMHQLMELRDRNDKISGHLNRNRSRDFTLKQEQIEERLSQHTDKALQLAEELAEARKQSVEEIAHYIFPIEVQELDEQDIENSKSGSSMDFSTEFVVEDDWLLSCQKPSVQPKITIVCSALPADGDYSDYIAAAKMRRKMIAKETEEALLHNDAAYTISAGLSHIAQYTWLLANVLDVHLAYPYSLVTAISDYGQCDLRPEEFKANVVRLNNNIVHLCFIQNVPYSAITPGHTLKNLHALVTHTYLGRLEPYICEPQLILSDPAGLPYMESDTQPPVTMAASEEDDVYSSSEEQYAVAMDTKNVMHKIEKSPSNKQSQERLNNRSPELLTRGENLLDDLVEASMTDANLQATPTSQEGVVNSSSSAVMNTLSNLWTSAWGSWQS